MSLSSTALIICGCCLLQGIVGLRLIKVVIPAYKLRGESALLECQYELNRSQSVISTSRDSNSNNNNNARMSIYGSSGTGRGTYGMGSNDGAGSMNGGGGYMAMTGTSTGGSMSSNGNSYSNNNNNRRIRNHQHQHYHYHDQYKNPNQDEIRSSSRGYHYGGSSSASSSYSAYGSDEQHDEGEALYSVKWYKDNEEFYRFVPKVSPPQQSYKVDGIRVDHQYSDSTKVLLRGLTLRSTGVYKCEVSAEAPNFSSVQGEGRMDIVYLPRDGPHIGGKEDQYQIGDMLNLNCTSGKSHPASQLQWFINDEPVMHPSSLIHYNNTIHQHGLVTSILGLQFMVDARHFHDGAMRVKCVASVSPILWQGDRESVLQRRPGPGLIDNREAMLLVLSSSPKSATSHSLLLLLLLAMLCLLKNRFPS